MNITETISLLDELRGKATQGEWRVDDEDGNLICNDDVLSVDMRQSDINYIAEMHNSYEALRQVALDGERYRKAGEELAKTLENLEENPAFLDHTGWYSQEEVDNALAAYRQAVEQKEV